MRPLWVSLIGLSLLAISAPVSAQRLTKQIEYTPEEYTEKGQTNGCGISFLTVWPADGGEIIGISGSINFFLVPEHKNVMAIIKATAVLDQKKTPVTYAWLESLTYGRSADFTKGAAADPDGFVGVKNSDPKAMALVLDLAQTGSVLGVSLKGRPLDDNVKLPPAPKDIQAKVLTCFSALDSHMQAVFR